LSRPQVLETEDSHGTLCRDRRVIGTVVCVVDAQGKIVKEAKISSEPAALVAFFEALGFAVKRIGLEAGHCRSGCMRG
jgi:hypothetical protein